MRVRVTRSDDVPWLARTLRAIADESPGGLFVVPPEEEFRERLLALGGVSFIATAGPRRIGLLVMLMSEAMFNPLVKTATVVSWWVEPCSRGLGAGAALMQAAVDAAKAASDVSDMSIFIADHPEGGVSIVDRLGFRPLERVYHKHVR